MNPLPPYLCFPTAAPCAAGGKPATAASTGVAHFVEDNRRPLRRVKQLFAALILFFAITLPALAEPCPPLLQHNFPVLQDGKSQSLCQWQGKVLLVVNTASFCGFTSQYDGLEKLYARLKSRGLVVVGFPSNEFGDQEPGGNQEIADFCRLTYGVQFPMFAKASVVGKQASPFYRQLATASGTEPQWNFHKYLIDRSGRQVLSFGSRVRPDDPELLARIDAFLGK
jgi:glutathione peroxidase